MSRSDELKKQLKEQKQFEDVGFGRRHYALVRCFMFPPTQPAKSIPAPPLCPELNLPMHETPEAASKWADKWHCSTLLRWRCRWCGHFHNWTVGQSMTDTNGGWCAGSDEAPDRILDEYLSVPESDRLFRFVLDPKERERERHKKGVK